MHNIEEYSYFITEGVNRLGYSVTPEEVSQLLIFLETLQQWNTKINLTSVRDGREIIIKHFLDSLAGLSVLPPKDSSTAPCRVIDVGTGAGFPGLPLKICRPKILLTLLEPRKKKAAFLHVVCGQLGLTGVDILSERIEILAKKSQYHASYDFLMSRALKVSEFLGPASSLLHANGQVVLWTTRVDEHLLRGGKTFSVWKRPRTISYQLPFEGSERNLVVLQKTR